MKKSKLKIPQWTTIYFFDGAEMQWRSVLTEDLPRLAGGMTFWRESMDENELASKMRQRFAETVGSQV